MLGLKMQSVVAQKIPSFSVFVFSVFVRTEREGKCRKTEAKAIKIDSRFFRQSA
jgi:hypothetical protein